VIHDLWRVFGPAVFFQAPAGRGIRIAMRVPLPPTTSLQRRDAFAHAQQAEGVALFHVPAGDAAAIV
jgi:hypothetical protein